MRITLRSRQIPVGRHKAVSRRDRRSRHVELFVPKLRRELVTADVRGRRIAGSPSMSVVMLAKGVAAALMSMP